MTRAARARGRRGPLRAGPRAARHLARGRGGLDRRRARPERRGQDDDAARDLRHRAPLGEHPVRRAARSSGVGPDGVARLGIAHVPEGRGTFSELTVWENLRLGAYTRRGSIKPELDRVFSYFPWLSERRRQQAGTLSGGEQQMLALARAFMQRPRLLLLDEPSLGLAPVLVAEIFRIVRELNEKEGLTVLVVEQNAHLALQAADSRLRARGRAASRSRAERGAQGRRLRPPELPRLLMATAATSRLEGSAAGAVDAGASPVVRAASSRPRSSCSSARLRSATFAQLTVAGTRARRGLRQPRARARPHLPRDRGDQLRAGRAGDGDDVHRVPAHPVGPLVLGGVLRDARDRLRARRRARGRRSSGRCSTGR